MTMVSEKWSKNLEVLWDSNPHEYGAMTLANTPPRGPLYFSRLTRLLESCHFSVYSSVLSGEWPQYTRRLLTVIRVWRWNISKVLRLVTRVLSENAGRLCTGRVVCEGNTYGLTISPTRWPRSDLPRQDSRLLLLKLI